MRGARVALEMSMHSLIEATELKPGAVRLDRFAIESLILAHNLRAVCTTLIFPHLLSSNGPTTCRQADPAPSRLYHRQKLAKARLA